MRLYALMVFLHVLAVVIWVGGMFLMHFAVRPVAVAQLPPVQRLPLMAEILGRFFGWVTVAVLVVLTTGLAMIVGIGAGADAEGKSAFGEGMRLAHSSVHLMFAIGLLMSLIFAFIRLVPYPRLRSALAAQQLPAAAGHLDLIRRWVATNLALGVLTVAVATAGRAF